MKKRSQMAVSGALLMLGIASVQAQQKPGLWEIHSKMSSPEMEQAMAQMQAHMSPEQRQAMKAHGVDIGSDGSTTAKICITKEMAARHEVPGPGNDCSSSVVAQTGNTTKIKSSCKNPPSSGEGTITAPNDSRYSMQMLVTSHHAGQSSSMKINADGKWLQPDCGDIRPKSIKGLE